jgi:hypothetical protein
MSSFQEHEMAKPHNPADKQVGSQNQNRARRGQGGIGH